MAHTTIDILKEAILLEKQGKAFYINVAEKTDSPAAKKIFFMMAEEEEEHIKFLSKQFTNYDKSQAFITPEGFEKPAEYEASLAVLTGQMRKEISAASFEAAAITAAMDFEKRAVKLYKDRSIEAIDPNEKEIYKMLYQWEMEHEKMLHELSEDLKEAIWNDNNFWAF